MRAKMRVETESQPFKLPSSIQALISDRVSHYGFSLDQPKPLAEAVRALSNLFIRGGAALGYWHVPAMRAAYTAYFFPLNYLRLKAICEEAAGLWYFDHARVIEDWGCGMGAASWAALTSVEPTKSVRLVGIDQSQEILDEFDWWSDKLASLHGNWPGRIQIKSALKKIDDIEVSKADTFLISYVFAEIEEWPDIPSTAERIIIVDPSTHQQGRKLLEFRRDLLEKGWYAWGPCTHQYDCPLLVGSGRDWCHHRIHWVKPRWYEAIEQNLPMRNDTLTMSYLILSKEPPPDRLSGLARVVGDPQEESGKTRQLICRGPKREFLSWLHREQHSIQLSRGDLLKLDNLYPKSNELRVGTDSLIEPQNNLKEKS